MDLKKKKGSSNNMLPTRNFNYKGMNGKWKDGQNSPYKWKPKKIKNKKQE
jgi:hypothetical protein